MADEQEVNYYDQGAGLNNTKIKDLEEKQRILKDRVLLISQNLIETKEKNDERALEMKKELEILKQKTDRMASFIETISSEFSKFAKKDEMEILEKQLRLLKPFTAK